MKSPYGLASLISAQYFWIYCMRKYCLFILLWLCCIAAFSQQSHFFANISRNDGLASDDVYGICQDKNGFYWIATDNGLQRFDGQRWMRPSEASANPILSRPIFQVVSLNNTLFLKSKEQYGILNTNDFTYSRVQIEQTNATAETHLWQDSHGTVFLIREGENLLAYDQKKNLFTEDALTIKYPRNLKPVSIFEDTINAHYWISGIEGIAVFNNKTGELYTKENNPQHLPLISEEKFKHVAATFIDSRRNYWIAYNGTNQRYACYSAAEAKYIPEAEKLNEYYKGTFYLSHFYETADNQFWLFGKGALFNYMHDEKEFYNTRSDITHPVGPLFGDVRQMMPDHENGVWIATDKGIYMFYVNLPVVKTIMFKTENDDNHITDAIQLPNEEIWMSSRGKGLIALKENKRIKLPAIFDHIPEQYLADVKNANTICRHSLTNQLWLGCTNGTLLIADPVKRSVQMLRPAPFGSASITTITENVTGQLFFGTNTGKIIAYDNTFREITKLNGPVSYLYADKQNRLWAATNNEGLFCLNASTGKTVFSCNNQNGLSSNQAKKIVQLNDSLYAVASDVLNIININTHVVKHYSNKDGLSGNTITSMEPDPKGYLWVSTSNGLCRFNINKRRFASYNQKDGFIPLAGFGTSSTTLNNGEIMFSGSNVLVSFPPNTYNNTKAPPAVRITDVRVNDSYVATDSLLRLKKASFAEDKNSFSIYFSAMSYFLNNKLAYYYKLSGVDNEWQGPANQAAAVYTHLPPGSYRFEVRCETEEGVSSPATSFTFRIRPPFWQTWWFISLIVFAVAALLFYLHRLRVNKIIALAELRSRVARDLHDDVGSTLSNISILSTMAKARLGENKVVTEQYIDKISDNSQQMMEAMDDIVWSIKPANDSMQKIIARMREVASGTLEPKDIDIDFYVDEKVFDLKLNMEARRDLFLIFKEAVNNIAKYSKSTHVLIHITYVRKRLMLKIKDNGIGFEIEKADNGNGLSNMRKRAAMLNARIKMFSAKGQGSQLLLNIPIN